MAVLEWDQAGQRRYETGIDHGVLYSPVGFAIPWNGLVSINETVSREVKPYYLDGIKFLEHTVLGDYSAKLSAFTYPDEMDELIGTVEFSPGVFLHDQPSSKLFHLSYRTMVANDLDGFDHGYKIHILYNLQATLSDTTMSTIGESVTAQTFEWTISGTTSSFVDGIRPTSHISLDSRRIDPAMLETLEEILYGSETKNPNLPPMLDLLNIINPT